MDAQPKSSICFVENIESIKNILVELEDRPLIYVNKIPSLEKMASFTVAIDLWNRSYPYNLDVLKEMFSRNSTEQSFSWDYDKAKYQLFDKIIKSVQNLPISVSSEISRLIRSELENIVKEIDVWMKYHQTRVFFHCSNELWIAPLLSYIVWENSGHIDYMKTAIEMLSNFSVELEAIEKYRIMCTFCLNEEIEKLKMLGFTDESKFEKESHPLIFYWNSIVRNKKPVFERPQNSNTISDESIMVTRVDNIHALRYFWKYLKPDEEVEKAIFIIGRHGLKYQDYVLRQLRTDQLDRLFDAIGSEIIINYINKWEYMENAWLIWLYLKERISKDEYVKLIVKLLDFDNNFLLNVWKTTPDILRRFVFSSDSKFLEFLSLCSEDYEFDLASNVSTLIEFLKYLDGEVRRKIIDNTKINWSQVFEIVIRDNQETDLFDEFLYLCLSNETERAEIRNKWISLKFIKQHCVDLIYNKEWEPLDDFLSKFTLPIDATTFKKHVVMSKTSCKAYASFLLFHYDCQLIDEIAKYIFSEPKAIMNFKKKLFLSNITISIIFDKMMIYSQLDTVKRCIAEVVKKEKLVEMVKKKFVQYCKKEKLTQFFLLRKEMVLDEFLLWAFNNDLERIEEFKNAIDRDAAFLEILEKIISSPKDDYNDYSFSIIDSFLFWCFDKNDVEVKKFKISKVYMFFNIKVLKELFAENKSVDLLHILNWFYDEDKTLVEEFRSVIKKWKDMLEHYSYKYLFY